MTQSLYLINPAADFPTYYGAEVYAGRGYRPAVGLADLVVPTLAAMVPESIPVTICDEHLEPVDFNTDADVIGITGKISQWGRTKSIAAAFRRRGKTVIIGGPNASLCPEIVRPHCDVLVCGEIEDIAEEFFADLAEGQLLEEYEGTRPDLSITPVPRWDLYSRYNDRVLTATLQTARGCPFECEFCDVIQYVGRKQRHKPIAHIIDELEMIHRHGYRSLLLADDNTTANKGWVAEMFEAVGAWNESKGSERIAFSTQLSIEAARDDELLSLAARSGLSHVFIGIETPNQESLAGTGKPQNLERNLRSTSQENPTLTDQVHRFMTHGIGVTGGMICGFDWDDTDIFERQFTFAQEAAAPIYTLSALAAPAATPLHDRLGKAGRLVEGLEVPGHPWNTNMEPMRMSRDELTAGIRWLANKLYHPDNFGERVERYIKMLSEAGAQVPPNKQRTAMRSVDRDTLSLIADIPKLDAPSARMWKDVMAQLPDNPNATIPLMEAMVRYQQIRFMYENGNFWDPPTVNDGAAAPNVAAG